MPYGDRTGPNGMGPLTGRRMGFCAGNDRPGYSNNGAYAVRGMGRGRGSAMGAGPGFARGAGRGRAGFYSAPGRAGGFYPEAGFYGNMDEAAILKEQEENLESELTAIKARIKTIDAAAKTKAEE